MENKCIYCLTVKPISNFSKREHVMPQCFGKFVPDNLILYKTVCDECNQYLGDNLELYLGRDTIEGVRRYKYGIRPRKAPARHKRLKFLISKSELKGMLVMPKYSDILGKDNIEPVLQAGFFNNATQKYDFFEPENIPSAKQLTERGYEIKTKVISLVFSDDQEKSFLLSKLKEKGMDIKLEVEQKWPDSAIEGKKILVEGTITIDRTIMRGIAKIAFNYLTYNSGKEFTLRNEFNEIRRFIRYDEGNIDDFFKANEPPILYNDRILKKFNKKTTNGHLVIVEWIGFNLISKISLFNTFTYRVIFINNFQGIWRPISYGHHFDVQSKHISQLISANSQLAI